MFDVNSSFTRYIYNSAIIRAEDCQPIRSTSRV